MVFGVVIAATSPVSSIAVLRRQKVQDRLPAVLTEAESLQRWRLIHDRIQRGVELSPAQLDADDPATRAGSHCGCNPVSCPPSAFPASPTRAIAAVIFVHTPEQAIRSTPWSTVRRSPPRRPALEPQRVRSDQKESGRLEPRFRLIQPPSPDSLGSAPQRNANPRETRRCRSHRIAPGFPCSTGPSPWQSESSSW